MSETKTSVQLLAEKADRRAQQAIDGKAAMREYQDQVELTREKTERLRALRLAQEKKATSPKAVKRSIKSR